jgi:DnaJ homolog subfamily C member 19
MLKSGLARSGFAYSRQQHTRTQVRLATLSERQYSRFGSRTASAIHNLPLGYSAKREDEVHEKSKRLHTVSLAPIQRRQYHVTAHNDRAAAIILGLGAVSAVSYAAASGIKAYREYKEYRASLPEEVVEEEPVNEETKEQVKQEEAKPQEDTGPRENIFAKWFDVGAGSRYYEGGFEDKMTRREAALILGVRESSSAKRIKDAHRKLLILNHPDTGGSTYISGKINEAKELLLKGKKEM